MCSSAILVSPAFGHKKRPDCCNSQVLRPQAIWFCTIDTIALVRFYENAKPFEEKRDELTISGWVYDEYHLELNIYDGLSEDILGNYAGYLAQAKLHEAEGKTIPSLQQQVADLETDKAALTEKVTSLEGQVTDTQMALCDVYEQIVAVTSTTGGE